MNHLKLALVVLFLHFFAKGFSQGVINRQSTKKTNSTIPAKVPKKTNHVIHPLRKKNAGGITKTKDTKCTETFDDQRFVDHTFVDDTSERIWDENNGLVLLTDSNFEDFLDLSYSKPIIIDFYANWCPPCKKMEPIMFNIARQYENRMVIGRYDIGNWDTTKGEKYNISSVPHLFYVVNRELHELREGFCEEQELEKLIEEAIQSSNKKYNLIYEMLEDRICDGMYYGPGVDFDYANCKSLFYKNLQNFNREHFKLTFDLVMIPSVDRKKKNIITIDTDMCIFGLHEEGGYLVITTDNQAHEYRTNIAIPYERMISILVVYDSGKVIINNHRYDVKMENKEKRNNVLSTINFSNGCALLGRISNLKVYNILE